MKIEIDRSWASVSLKKNALILDMVVAGSLIALMHQQQVLPLPVVAGMDFVFLLVSEVFDMFAFHLKEGKPCMSFI